MFGDSNLNIKPLNPSEAVGLDYYSDLVQGYYGQLEKAPSTAGQLFSSPEITNVVCDPLMHVNNLLGLIKEPVSSVLSVIGPNAPEFFKKKYPKAQINAFDINPNQLRVHTPIINDDGGNVFVADIAVPGELSNLFEKVKPNVVFISNISEYLSPEENLAFGDEVIRLANAYKLNLILTEVQNRTDIISPVYSQRNGLRLSLWEYLHAAGLSHEFECTKNFSSSAHMFSSN